MVLNELYKSAKSLNYHELQKLIAKLKSFLEKKREKAELKEKLLQEEQDKAQRAIEEIERTVLASGLTLKQLGLISPCTTQVTNEKPKRYRNYTYNANNRYYITLDDNAVEIIFGRKISIYKAQGKALRFSDLNQKQQAHAKKLVAAKNDKAH